MKSKLHKVLKWSSLSITVMVILLLCSMLSINVNTSLSHTIHSMSQWFTDHRALVIVWHLLICIAIFYFFGVKVKRVAKAKHNISDKEKKRLLQIRWYMIAFVIMISLLR